MKPTVWTIAGSDSGGGAGIQADLETFRSFGVHGASVVTAITAQNTVDVDEIYPVPLAMIGKQWDSLAKDLPPKAIKLGMLGSGECSDMIAERLNQMKVPVICDPVLGSGSGTSLSSQTLLASLRQKLLPKTTLVTPNRLEALKLTQRDDVVLAAKSLLAMGPESILIKGGHGLEKQIRHYWSNSEKHFWIEMPRLPGQRFHGTGCTFSSAIAALMAKGLSELDAIVGAEVFVSRSLKSAFAQGQGARLLNRPPIAEADFSVEDLPHIYHRTYPEFPRLRPKELGFYPLVDRAERVMHLLKLGVKSIQLRIKELTGSLLDNEVRSAVEAAKQYDARLWVNDHWELAIKNGAFGVHLGQEDLAKADFGAIASSGLRLGVSTHSYFEMGLANAIKPSYVAIGPVFATTAKRMSIDPLGVERFSAWRKFWNCPVVAIGGITLEKADAILKAGADSIAVINDVKGEGIERRVEQWVQKFACPA